AGEPARHDAVIVGACTDKVRTEGEVARFHAAVGPDRSAGKVKAFLGDIVVGTGLNRGGQFGELRRGELVAENRTAFELRERGLDHKFGEVIENIAKCFLLTTPPGGDGGK